MSGGFRHTCGILGDGTAFCWGDNGAGQLGDGSINLRDSLPRVIAGLIVFTRIDGGQGNSCGIRAGGAAYCWGAMSDGALGNDTATRGDIPSAVAGGLKFKAITVGWSHSCGLTTAGAAYCWGNNDFGKLGADTTATFVSHPVPVSGGHTFMSIAAGDFHTCALALDGTAYCWGDNNFGALGTGDTTTNATHGAPQPVAGGLKFKAIDGGNTHTCGVTTGGKVYCWGSGAWGQLGNGAFALARVPVAVATTRTFTTVSLGTSHSCALETGGALYCWGSNGADQLGGTAAETCIFGPGPSDNAPCMSTPIRSANGQAFRAIGVGGFHSCAIALDGGAYCWGSDDYGQVGNGAIASSVGVPVRVADPHID